jgi:hypothetical protein
MRAVKNNLPTPSGKVEESEGPRWTRAIQGATQTTIFGRVGKREGDQLALMKEMGSLLDVAPLRIL